MLSFLLYAQQGIQGILAAHRTLKGSHAFVFPSKPKFGILCEGKKKASHTKEKIITVFYAKQGFEKKREVCEPFIPPSLRIKASHAFCEA